MKLLDKDALVADITSLKVPYECGWNCALDKVLEHIDDLEVKDVDFEKELDRIWFDNKLGNYFDNDALDFAHVRTLCKHFFELGLKAVQKGE